MAKSQKQTGLTRRPIVFYRNSTCPEYSLGETNFIVDNVFTPATVRTIRENAARQAALAQDTSIPEPYRLSPSYYYQDQIARCLIVRESRARYTSEVAKYVVQAVKQFGVAALKLNGFDKYRLDPDPNIMNEKMAKADAFSRVIEPYIRSAAHENQNLSNKLTPEVLKAAREAADRVSIPKKLRLKKRDPLQYMNPLGRAREEAELFELRYRDSLGSVICQRRALEAELARRNGTANSFPHLRENNPAESFSGLLTWAEFLSATPVEREWLIDGLIPTTGLGVIQGRGKQGKSTLVIHLCRAVGLATPFLSRDTRQSPAVYINYEMPDDYLQSLIRSAEVPVNSFVINRPEPILRLETIETIVEEAVSKVGSSNGLLVIDSFRGAFKLAGKAENLAGEAGVLLRRLQDLAIAKRWFFLLVHHRNRSSTEGTDSISGTGD